MDEFIFDEIRIDTTEKYILYYEMQKDWMNSQLINEINNQE
jgi:hypothetical protein